MINQGIELMFVGMGFVFFFLIILVMVMTLSSKIIKKIEANRPQQPEKAPQPAVADNKAQIAAVIAAVKSHIGK